MFKYHAKEERWQNLVCTDFQLHATHFWLFVCLMCEKYCTKFIQYHSLVHRSQTQRRENVNVVVKSSEVIQRDIFLFSSLLKLKNIITKWNNRKHLLSNDDKLLTPSLEIFTTWVALKYQKVACRWQTSYFNSSRSLFQIWTKTTWRS